MAPVAFLLTFLSVVFAMVLFRAPSVAGAVMLWKGMIGSYGATLPQAVLLRLGPVGSLLQTLGVQPAWTSGSFLLTAAARIAMLLFIALALPNTLELLAAYEPALGVKPAKASGYLVNFAAWQPNGTWAFGLACVALAGILSLGGLHEFIYWQF
jgi:alginate O-acetyltransferase complex protein AlgI